MDDEEYRETRGVMADQLRKDLRYQEAYTHLADAGEEAARIRADDQKDADEQLEHNTENARMIATKAGERVDRDQADIEAYDKAHGFGLMEPDWGDGGGGGAGELGGGGGEETS
jgi:transposase